MEYLLTRVANHNEDFGLPYQEVISEDKYQKFKEIYSDTTKYKIERK